IIIDGEKIFTMILVRAKEGVMFPDSPDPVKTLFFIVASTDERNFYLRSLMAIAEIVQEKDFEEKWMAASSKAELEDVILLASRKREEVLH
ncbi:MAG: PTS sugar transporter subunit IIA, partial [Elusimicrobiota bacterium]|nr:PTS sugar transporter subunit IIA [Elusimicrobiota bacterium]